MLMLSASICQEPTSVAATLATLELATHANVGTQNCTQLTLAIYLLQHFLKIMRTAQLKLLRRD